MKAYLAGPEVFFPDRVEAGERKKRVCAAYGVEGLYPLDQNVDPAAGDAATRIFLANVEMIRRADVVIANLTPFRGVSADVGTAVEIGIGFALGKPVHGYSNVAAGLFERTAAASEHPATHRSDGFAYHHDGMSIEAFGLADNLMLIEAIRRSGGVFHAPAAGAHEVAVSDLTLFEACVAAAAAARAAA